RAPDFIASSITDRSTPAFSLASVMVRSVNGGFLSRLARPYGLGPPEPRARASRRVWHPKSAPASGRRRRRPRARGARGTCAWGEAVDQPTGARPTGRFLG